MKKSILFIILCFSGIAANAQDTIVMKSGKKIIAKVLEISAAEIKYKKYANLEGPDHIENKKNVAEIVYSNGTKETITVSAEDRVPAIVKQTSPDTLIAKGRKFIYKEVPVSFKDLEQTLLFKDMNPKFQKLIVHKIANDVTYAASFVGIPLMVIGVITMMEGYINFWGSGRPDPGTLRGGEIFTAVGLLNVTINIYTFSSSSFLNRKIARTYNETYDR